MSGGHIENDYSASNDGLDEESWREKEIREYEQRHQIQWINKKYNILEKEWKIHHKKVITYTICFTIFSKRWFFSYDLYVKYLQELITFAMRREEEIYINAIKAQISYYELFFLKLIATQNIELQDLLIKAKLIEQPNK